MILRKFLRQEHLIGGTLVLGITQLAASVVGLLRDRILTAIFPVTASSVVDIYIASFRPADFLLQTCIISALGTVLVPVLAGYHAHGDRKNIAAVLSSTILVGGTLFTAIAVLAVVALPLLAPHLVSFTGQDLALYIRFTRIVFLSDIFFVVSNTLGQYLITVQRYWIYGLTPVLYTLGTIGGAIFLTPVIGPMGPIVGTVIGSFVYLVLRWWAAANHGMHLSFAMWHPDLHGMGMLMLPRMLSVGALQAQMLVFDSVASGLDAGSITINAYARNFQSVLVGVTGIALAQSIYSLLSQSAAANSRFRFVRYLRWGVGALLVITIPGAIALTLLTPVAASLVHLTDVLPVFSVTLMVYAVSVPFESMNHLLLRAYYACRQTLLPAFSVVIGVAAAVVAAILFARSLGVEGLAVGFTIGQITQMAMLSIFLMGLLRRMNSAA